MAALAAEHCCCMQSDTMQRDLTTGGHEIWPVHLEGPSEQKPIKNFGEKGAWAYAGTAHFFGCPLLSTNF